MFTEQELELVEEVLHDVASQIQDDLRASESLSSTSMATLENMWERLTNIASKAGQMAVDLA